ncbi:hypothetical protein BDV59DRAFT_168598 [Aspergillus ambiguus]|uniref:RNA-binding protein n=1 Tax=Aspergillus ambiguus TaxID=176160 RepID=UPI003CCD70FB
MSSSSYITVEKCHLEYLLQKAGADVAKPADSVTILQSDYKRLLQDADHLKRLKESLLNGGLSPETLNVLIYGSSSAPDASHVARVFSHRRHGDEHSNYKLAPTYDDADDGVDDVDEILLTSPDTDERGDYDESSSNGTTESATAPTVRRTILVRNLPDRVTHRDICQAMKGGALLHIYLRAREHNANISFVEEVEAHEFLKHAKAHGLYIAGKRAEVTWNDRQFYLPPYVRSKINNGASRNLVIHNINPNITEGLIRRDLDHIHNLIVIAVSFKHGNAYVSTNSVHNALFARSCMMSRLTYKGMKIGFYPDECTAPLVAKSPIGHRPATSRSPSGKAAAVPNRFQLLSLDAGEDGESEDDPVEEGLRDQLEVKRCWPDNRIST